LHDLQRAEFYAQDIAILRSLGHDVYVATGPRQLRRSTDAIFCWWWTYAWQAALAGRLLGIPVVSTGVFDIPTYAQRPLYQRLLMRLGAHLSSANVFVSKFELEGARQILGLRHASYSPLAVDTATYFPAPAATPKDSDKFLIANVTSKVQTSVRRKMLRELIEAMPLILAQVPHARLVLAGPPEDGEAQLRALAAELELSTSVTFFGELSREEKIDLYRVCDLYVQCSRYEGFGLAIAEAMACGAPVVVSRVPPVVELVGSAGVYVSDATPGGIAEAVIGLASDPQRRRDLAVQGVARIRSEFSIGRRATDIANVLRDVKRPRSKRGDQLTD
jgi:glycosyltransferase involved in cell wall biosynthesis